MANETTVTTLTELVNSEFIDTMVGDYLIDSFVVAPLAYTLDISGAKTLDAAFPRWIKDSGSDVTEATAMSNTALETEEATATAAQVGILRELTELAADSNVLGAGEMAMQLARDGAQLMGEMLEDDLCALFLNITNVVGEATTDLSIANMVAAQAKRRTLKARGRAAFVLDDEQALHLQSAVAASSASVFTGTANQSVLNGRSDGYLGDFLGDEVYYSNLTDTSNTGASVNGALITTADNPSHASLGIAMKWAPRVRTESNVANISNLYAISACYGVSLKYDTTAVKVKTDA